MIFFEDKRWLKGLEPFPFLYIEIIHGNHYIEHLHVFSLNGHTFSPHLLDMLTRVELSVYLKKVLNLMSLIARVL